MEAITLESIRESTTKLKGPRTGLEARMIDLTIKYPDVEYLFEKENYPCISRGDIHVLKGKAKSGKSTFMKGLISALIMGQNFGFKALKKGCKALYIDTEQNDLNTVKTIKTVHAMCGIPEDTNHECIKAYNLRGDDPIARKTFIQEAITANNPDFVILDGIKDIIIGGDINSATECNDAVQFLMTLTKQYNIAILTVLHENKNDENLRGHVGTELQNKCCEIWQIKKEENIFHVEQIENRNGEAKIRFDFRFDEDHFPEILEAKSKLNRSEQTYQKKIDRFYLCLKNGKQLSYTQLTSEYCEAYGCKETQAQNDISTFRMKEYLIRDDETGLYHFNSFKVQNIGSS